MRKLLTVLLFVTSGLLSTLFMYGCVDSPESFVSPSWDLSLNVPVKDKTYTLKEVIQKDTSSIKWYPAGSTNANMLYYADKKTIEPVTIGDKVKLDKTVQSVTSQKIGEIKIKDPSIMSQDISFSFDTTITPGSTQIFPSQTNAKISITLPLINQFNYIILNSGALSVSLKNNLPSPVDLTLSGMSLRNKYNTVPVGTNNSQVVIPAGQTKNIVIDLTPGIKIYNQLVFNCLLSTNGSGTKSVAIPNTAVNVSANLSSLSITEVSGQLKENIITSDNTVQIDDSTKYTSIEIESGNIQLDCANNIDAGFNAKLVLNPNSSAPFEYAFRVERKASPTFNISLNNVVLKSLTPTTAIDYEVQVKTDSTTDNRIIHSTDTFSSTVTVNPMTLKRFEGIVKPTKLEVKSTSVSLNLKDLKDKFKFDKLILKNPSVKINLNTTSKLKLRFDGQIAGTGSASALKFSGIISHDGVTSNNVISIPTADMENFLASFTPGLPSELTITGNALINPNYEQILYSFAKTDSITGNADISFPLNVGIDGGTINDTSSYDPISNQEEIKKVQSVLLTIDITNGLAAKVKFQGSLLDPAKIKLIDLPPNRQPGNDYIEIPAATVDANGKVISPAVKQEVIELKGSDVTSFLNGKYIVAKMAINTSGSVSGTANPVEFKITDAIRIKASGKLVYRVSEK
ncbi:MAG: hypothetical protein WCJ01_03050 [Ignavibacteria bacterium]